MIGKSIPSEIYGSVQQEHCGVMEEQDIWKISLSDNIIDVEITNVGCSVMKIYVSDKHGQKQNVIAGFEKPQNYLNNDYYVGCIVGRYANRIKYGKFYMDGKEHQLTLNDGNHHLHGGPKGFHKRIWKLEKLESTSSGASVELSYASYDGEEGYPGKLTTTAVYSVENGSLHITYKAVSDKPTIVNLANHCFFNLSGFAESTIYTHLLQVNASQYTLTDEELIPTGALADVANTAFDFRLLKDLGSKIQHATKGKGYDVNFCVSEKISSAMLKSGVLYHPGSGRMMEIFSNQPGLQVYTANNWDSTEMISKGFQKNAAIALETQVFPDSPNQSTFPFNILFPGDVYEAKTVLKFGIM